MVVVERVVDLDVIYNRRPFLDGLPVASNVQMVHVLELVSDVWDHISL